MSDTQKRRVRALETMRKKEFGIEKILEYFREDRPLPDFAPGENTIIDCLNEIWEREKENITLELVRS